MGIDKSNFCTLFDHNYLSRGLVLYESLIEHSPQTKLYVLCLSDECYSYLTAEKYSNLFPVHLKELEEADVDLERVKNTRSWVEYIFTLSPCWPLFLLKNNPDIAMISTVDADAKFFADPSEALSEMEEASIGITSHRFPPKLKNLEIYGKYNVGFQSFKNDNQGVAALSWWRDRCLEWCCDVLDKERFADQKYLDYFPELFNAMVFKHKGLNVAPWNVDLYRFTVKDNHVFVDDEPLVFFHFQGVKPASYKNWWNTGLGNYGTRMTKCLRDGVFLPYIKLLLKAAVKVEIPLFSINLRQRDHGNFIKRCLRSFITLFSNFKGILTGCWLRIK